MGHMVLFDEHGELGDGLLLSPLSVGRVDHSGVQHLSGGVHHRHFTPHTVARVQAHRDKPLHRRLHEQRLEVQGKLADGSLIGVVSEGGAHLPLQGRGNEPVIGVFCGGLDKVHGRRARSDHRPADGHQSSVPVHVHGYLQDFLPLSPVDGQNLMPLGFGNRR